MAKMIKKVLSGVVAFAGVAALTGIGLTISPVGSSDKAAQTKAANPGNNNLPTAEPQKTTDKNKPIRGIVKDKAGSPIVGATVFADNTNSNAAPLTTTTDKKGQFTIEVPKNGQDSNYRFLAVKDGYALANGYASDNRDSEVALTLSEAAESQGTVKDQAGRPIVGAEVFYGVTTHSSNFFTLGYPFASHLHGTSFEKFYLAKTDAAGVFRFTTVPAGASLIFRATAEGFAEADPKTGGRSWSPADIIMVPEAVVKGRIISRVSGIEVEGLNVRLNAENHGHWLSQSGPDMTVKADKQGRFIFKGLPASDVTLTIDLPERTRATYRYQFLTTKSGETREVNLELIEGVEVFGTVRVRGSGQPAAGAWISAGYVISPSRGMFVSRGNSARAECDAAGRFVLRLPPGEITLNVQGTPGYGRPVDSGVDEGKVMIRE